MKKKELYEAPSVETYELVNEKVLCGSPTNPDGKWDNSIKEGTTWDTSTNDYGLI